MFGILYWALWRVILPKVLKYEPVPVKETLSDGTVVTVVWIDLPQYSNCITKLNLNCSSRTRRSNDRTSASSRLAAWLYESVLCISAHV